MDHQDPTTHPQKPVISSRMKRLIRRVWKYEDDGKAREDAEQRAREYRIRQAKGRLGRDLGRRYVRCTLDNFQVYDERQAEVLRKLRAIDVPAHVREGNGLILYGRPGTGKDHLAASLLKSAAEDGLIARWVNGEELHAEIRAGFSSGRSEAEIKRELVGCDVLCLSDPVLVVDKTSTDFNLRTLYDIISRRYSRQKATWATLNVARSGEAKSKLGPQVFSRLMDGAVTAFCNWPDYRERR